MTTMQLDSRHNYDGPCHHPRCTESDGWQCASCGHYDDRNHVKDDRGEYYHRDGMGCRSERSLRRRVGRLMRK